MSSLVGVDLKALRRKAVATAQRFPMASACAAIVAAGIVLLVDSNPGRAASRAAWRMVAAASCGFPLFVAARTFAERKEWGGPATIAARAGAGLLAAACAFALPDHASAPAVFRLVLLLAGLLPLISLAPFPCRGEINGFWQYNRALFSRFLVAVLYTQVPAAAVGLAVAGADAVAGIGVPASLYARLWVIVSVPAGSLVFLRGVPVRPEKLQTAISYPRWLEVLTRTVLIPLVGLCLIALYAYALTIVGRASWPRGGAAGYVLIVSAAGILTYLLVYPVREKAESRLVAAFMRGFFPAVLPLAVLLFLSVWRRISDYGVTESRYFGVLAAAWLAATCAYFIAGKAKNIKAIPASIAAVALLSSFGPWGAPAFSAQNQAARLQNLLVRNGILCGDRIRPAPEAVPEHDEGEISRIVRYLSERGETDVIARWFGPEAPPKGEREAMARMGLSFDPSRRGKEIHFMARDARSLKVAGYDYSVKLSAPFGGENTTWEAPVDQPAGRQGRYRLVLDGKEGKLFLTEGRDTVLAADIVPLVRKLRSEFRDDGRPSPVRVPREKLEIAETRGYVGIKVCLSEIVGTEREGTVRFGNVEGEVLVKTAP